MQLKIGSLRGSNLESDIIALMDSAENQTITLSDGRKLGYAEYGDLKGQPLFYFHGWPSSRLQAQIHDKTAKKLKIRIISLDRPGIGLSSYKENRKLLDYSEDVITLADRLKIKKFAVMGVSGGGPYAAVCAYKIPQRITKVGIVVGLAPTWIPGILNGMSLTGRLGWENFAKYPLVAYVGTKYHEFEIKYFPSLFSFFEFRATVDKKVLKTLTLEAKRNKQEAFRQGSQGARKDLGLYTKDWGFSLKDIQAKVYLFYGKADKNVTLAMGKYYASQIKNSKLTIYPHEGHLIQVTHQEEILKTLIN